ncbi:hypothetical protein GCM10010185_47820 [Saccharothrix coeruleofusca]|uniref:Uncharacterized protein n=1 Tax=Saccharothrix coeruleofusca TaxID=33919 RepID=A0A918ATF4_9PSEU|nr:hypothetical protein GCM10010185_47820 [Saccharothrix coeruleofusca]
MADLDAFVALEASLRPERTPDAVVSARYLSAFTDVWERGELGYWTVLLHGEVMGFGGVQPKLWHGRRCWNLQAKGSRRSAQSHVCGIPRGDGDGGARPPVPTRPAVLAVVVAVRADEKPNESTGSDRSSVWRPHSRSSPAASDSRNPAGGSW